MQYNCGTRGDLECHNGGYRYVSRQSPLMYSIMFICMATSQPYSAQAFSFRSGIQDGITVLAKDTEAVWLTQKVPRTGEEDTAPGIRIADIAYLPILYPGPLGSHPFTRVPLGSLRVKRVFGTLASPGYLQVTSPRISYLNFFFLTSTQEILN